MAEYRYYRSDFPSMSGMGNARSAPCPVCGSRDNLKINLGQGFVHCYSPGCEFHHGKFVDDTRPDDEPFGQPIKDSNIDMGKTYTSDRGDQENAINPYDTYITSDSQVPVLISDYRPSKKKSMKFMKMLKPLTDDPESADYMAPGMSMARQYFKDMCIGVKTAIEAGILVGETSWSTKEIGHSSSEKEEYVTVPVIAFPTTVNGNIMALKLRIVSMTDGEYDKAYKSEKLHKDLPTPPYGIDAVHGSGFMVQGSETSEDINNHEPLIFNPKPSILNHEPLIFTEGEKDALALRAAGFPFVLSVPNGAGEDPRKSLKPFMEVISKFQDVVICGDNDRKGRFLEMRLKYIFKGRARIAIVPEADGKDIADVLLARGIDGVREVINEAKCDEISNIIRPNDLSQKIIDSLQGKSEQSYSLGFGPEFDRHLRLTNRGGLIVATGLPGDGKSDFLVDMAARLILNEKKRFTFCSMEEPNVENLFADLMHRVLNRADLSHLTTQQYLDEINFLDQYVSCYNIHKGDPSGPEIVRECDRQWDKFRTDFLIIDNYARLKRDIKESQNETDFVRDLLAALQDWGIAHGVWVIIVAHPRKIDHLLGENTVHASDISGSAHWYNLADFVISIRRIYQPDEGVDYKIIDVQKVRDQRICKPGRVQMTYTAARRHEVG